ncbi:embryonic stem cell-specific 5-hydroxymethylcytosine-binding protein [Rhynchospora pubera]|uniref:Embryonic stem cell-specific 5-hydroxymethylcytosine-binding protein n=1 Tax=Rhynchospora pubera TaxID=906938 RepID=A0AAV8HQP2_9POAL|nr:embryonic stem cell-specific 5-hydroxymethylcytosine-binding protein [Rhynchospora pubera]
MCGRARCTLNPNQVAAACGFTGDGGGRSSVRTVDVNRFQPSYNVSPGRYVPVATVRRVNSGENGGNEVEPVVHCMKWGLVPSFTKKNEKPDHYKMFNARSESIKEKASFRRLIPANRCLVAVEGFYEWKKDGSKKQPYYIHFKDDRPLVFAALYDSWSNSDGEVLYTFTILTTRCSTSFEWLHDRMPVVLGSRSCIDSWLDTSNQKFESLLVPYEGLDLVWHPVTSEVGKTSCDGPECIKEIQLKPTSSNYISKFFTKKSEGGIKPEKDDSKEADAVRIVKKEKSSDYQLTRVKIEEKSESGDAKKEETNDYDHVQKETPPFEPKCFYTSEKEKQSPGVKRDFGEVSDSDILPVKKEKAAKKGDGQVSLLSYFGKK